jgi:hypothetical protein
VCAWRGSSNRARTSRGKAQGELLEYALFVGTDVFAHLPVCLLKGGGRESPLDQVRDGLREEGGEKKEENIARRYSREKHFLGGGGQLP